MSKIRIWIDDQLEPPRYNKQGDPQRWDVHCRTAEPAIILVRSGQVEFVDFDHDLADASTGYDVAKEIERLAAEGKIPPIDYAIHSGNSVGAANIDSAMKSAWRFWN